MYIPYQKNQTLNFTNGTDTSSFIITNYFKSEQQSVPARSDVSCIVYSIMRTSFDSLINNNIEYLIINGVNDVMVTVTFKNDNFSFTFSPTKKSYTYKSNNYPIIDSLLINYKMYRNLIVIQGDTIIKPGINTYKFYIAEHFGIVKFCQRNPASEWVYIPE